LGRDPVVCRRAIGVRAAPASVARQQPHAHCVVAMRSSTQPAAGRPPGSHKSLHHHQGRRASLAAGARLRGLASARLLAGAVRGTTTTRTSANASLRRCSSASPRSPRPNRESAPPGPRCRSLPLVPRCGRELCADQRLCAPLIVQRSSDSALTRSATAPRSPPGFCSGSRWCRSRPNRAWLRQACAQERPVATTVRGPAEAGPSITRWPCD
jgi:hypothetical protein